MFTFARHRRQTSFLTMLWKVSRIIYWENAQRIWQQQYFYYSEVPEQDESQNGTWLTMKKLWKLCRSNGNLIIHQLCGAYGLINGKKLQAKFLKGTRKSSALWFAKLSNEIWKITEDLWRHRNHCEHEDMRTTKVDTTIEEIYGRLPRQLRLLPMADRNFFRNDSEWIKRRRLRDKEKWCKQAEKIVQAYEKIAIMSSEARLLRRYFLDNG